MVPNFLLVFALICCLTLLNNNGVEAFHKLYPRLQSVPSMEVKNLLRTRFHFQPVKHWMNDPNGPMFYKGIYHLFYQYNPKGSVWGNIVWAHSVSTDMINWKALEPAIYPSKSFDIKGCWSGSATILPGNKPIILYTGIDSQQRQLQNYAIPANESDPYLREWIKPDRYNPIVVPTIGINATAFRDPTTAWLGRDGHWRILVGGKRRRRGIAFLYRSRDFMTWVKAKHSLHTAANTGMWECPDFYPISLKGNYGLDTSVNNGGVKHVLKVSLDETRYEYYTIGTYKREKDMYIPDKDSVDGWHGLRYDYGNFYASKSFFDAKRQRRILWGWANESDIPDDDVKKGWAGIQTIPRTVWLDSGRKQLLQWPIQELETLRQKKVEMTNHILKKGDHVEIKGITAAQADVDVTFSFPTIHKAEQFDDSFKYDAQLLCSMKGSQTPGEVGPFGLLTLASENLEEYTPVFFRIFKNKNKHKILMCSDAKSSSLKDKLYKPSFAGYVDVDLAGGEISLRSLIDHSVVESFGAGGKTCITSRVYPTLAVDKDAHLYVFNNGAAPVTVKKLNAWSMKSPQMNVGEK